MAQIPQKASLKFGSNTNISKQNIYPYITLENVYVFPGSPIFLEKSFQSLYEVNVLVRIFLLIVLIKLNCIIFILTLFQELLSTNKRFVKEEMFINVREDLFANALSTVVKEFPNVSFGSYPVSNCR